MEDRILLAKACNDGSVKSLDEIYAKYWRIVRSYLGTVDPNDCVDDICQEVFARICDRKCSYGGNSEVETFLLAVARNILHEALRAEKIKTCPQRQMKVLAHFLTRHTLPGSPIEALQTKELNHIVRTTICGLPPKSRQAVELVYIAGIPASKAARLIGCDFKVFRDRLNYGLRRLRQKLKDSV
ncbi:MAG TPA: sigma-70 family RNA polymerase sigma factor [Sedimentisphaerales bacterium]|nr:sigma-70 family RNA polymerase sigma factor [Sedimentisphaerales bacterium]